MSRDFLTTDDILEIHNVLVEQYGGTAGIRDMSGLEAAVFRPQSGYYANIVEEACALFESILINHPFVDGNKRTAFASCDVFLRINGYDLSGDDQTLYKSIISWTTLPSPKRNTAMNCDLEKLITAS